MAGQLRGQAEFLLFDYLDQGQSEIQNSQSDQWGRGPIGYERIESPAPLKNIPRYFRRFGLPRPLFIGYLREQGPLGIPRTTKQKGILSRNDLENIEVRVASTYGELRQAWRFTYVIPNHDGEDSDNWDAFYYPVGEARKTLMAFAGLLEGNEAACVEKWEQALVP